MYTNGSVKIQLPSVKVENNILMKAELKWVRDHWKFLALI